MKVLSLFDGISCARVALERAGIPVEEYVASEIDPYAMTIAQRRYPDTFGVGSIVGLLKSGWINTEERYFDLIIGGSPCQDLSIAKKGREGLKGKRSGLFYEFVKIKDTLKPKWFILENVASMPKEAKDEISKLMGVEPIMINASLVSAQNRKRLFWTNIPNITQPEDRGILLKDILESGETDRLKSYAIDANYFKGGSLKNYLDKSRRQVVLKQSEMRLMVRVGKIGKGGQGDRVYSPKGKSVALSSNGGGRGAKTGLYVISSTQKHATISKDKSTPLVSAMGMGGGHVPILTTSGSIKDIVRKLTPIECERLQSLPDNYTKGISDSQRYKCLGNAFNVDVVAHILSFIPKKITKRPVDKSLSIPKKTSV